MKKRPALLPPPRDPGAALAPLKVLIVAERTSSIADDRLPYFNAITRAFQGGTTRSSDGAEEYYAAGDDLGVDVRRIVGEDFWKNAALRPDVWKDLEASEHLLVVVFLQGAASPEFRRWLDGLARIALQAEFRDRISILPLVLDPTAEQTPLDQFDEFQRLPIAELGESALRAGYLGLLALQCAWTLLGAGSEDRLKLFVSHAKRDGAPIALALRSQINSLRFLQSFYDAQDILPGTLWRRVLRDGVKKSALVVLRTDIYEQRPWCVQEFEWAEEFGCPTLVVDARHSLTMPRESLPIAGMASVRIPDGNVVRILNAVLREAVRGRLFHRAIQLLQRAGALPNDNHLIKLTRASLSMLGVACEAALRAGRSVQAVVAAESFRELHRPPAERLLRAYYPSARLGTLRDFATRPLRWWKAG